MRRSLLIILMLAAIITGCAKKQLPLKGNYYELPFQIETTKSAEEIIENLKYAFAKKNLRFKTIDKSRGILISETTKIPVTYEDLEGSLKDTTAYVVIPLQYNWSRKKYLELSNDKVVTGNWEVTIVENSRKTIVIIQPKNLQYKYVDRYKETKIYDLTIYQSTDVFQKQVQLLFEPK